MLISAPKVTVRRPDTNPRSPDVLLTAPLVEEHLLAVRVVLASTDHDALRDVHRQLDVAALRLQHVLELIARRRLAEQMESHMDSGPSPA